MLERSPTEHQTSALVWRGVRALFAKQRVDALNLFHRLPPPVGRPSMLSKSRYCLNLAIV
jgi:hypothetical protein